MHRTSAWISKHRRTARDYEHLPAGHEAMILWAMIALMTRRLARAAHLSGTHRDPGFPLRTFTHARSFTCFPDARADLSDRDEARFVLVPGFILAPQLGGVVRRCRARCRQAGAPSPAGPIPRR